MMPGVTVVRFVLQDGRSVYFTTTMPDKMDENLRAGVASGTGTMIGSAVGSVYYLKDL